MAVWIWTFGQDAMLRRAAKAGRSIEQAATEIGCSYSQAYYRAGRLNLKFPDGREADDLGKAAAIDERPEYSKAQLLKMNDAFARRMLKAIKSGQEKAPIGTIAEPSTHYARVRLAYQAPLTQSGAADLI